MKAIRVHKFGGPDELQLEEIDIPEPGRGEARVMLKAAGVNYVDIYQRTGPVSYTHLTLPTSALV